MSATREIVQEISPAHPGLRVNGGFFVMRNEIFDTWAGEELVEHHFNGLSTSKLCWPTSTTDSGNAMDTFKDKQRLEELNQDEAPWKVWTRMPKGVSNQLEVVSAAV